MQTVRAVVEDVLGSTSARIRRMADWSTYVYQLHVDGRRLFLRILPEAGDSLEPEAIAHRLLARLGVQVPDVIAVVGHHPAVDLSVMVTSAIAGRDTNPPREIRSLESILREAGRQAAVIHSLPVRGAGWVTRTPGISELRGDYRDHRDWFERELWPLAEIALRSGVLDDLHGLPALLERADDFMMGSPRLVHGDMGCEHIFHVRSRFSGFIDFGEIRGAPPPYDLATHCRYYGPRRVDPFLGGYAEASPVDVEFTRQVDWWIAMQDSVMLGRRQTQGHELASLPALTFMKAAIDRGLSGWVTSRCVELGIVPRRP